MIAGYLFRAPPPPPEPEKSWGPVPRNGFRIAQKRRAWALQNGECPCCFRELNRIRRGVDAHHADGDRSNDSSDNCLMVCKDCHAYCIVHSLTEPPIFPDECPRQRQ